MSRSQGRSVVGNAVLSPPLILDAGTRFGDADQTLEPFLKSKQDGMGMGLAICRSIIEARGARLWTTNNETPGATISFTLPLPASEAA